MEVFMNEFMNIAIDEARKAFTEGNVPVGAVIVKDDKVVSVAHNRKNSDNISIFHAELLCIIEACKYLKSWHLDDCVMYVTLKPCDMCEAAIAESRIEKVYYLLESNYSLNMNSNINNIMFGKIFDDSNYAKLLSDFFRDMRK